MIPDEHIDENAKSDFERAELAARIDCRYVKAGLSPPFHLREAVRHWGGLSHDEIMAVIELHFDACRRFYTTGSGDRLFYMVELAIRRAIEAKYPRNRSDGELKQPRRRSRVRQVHTAAGGLPDVYVEGHAARLVRRTESERPSLAGYTGDERVGVPSLEDDEADA